MLILIHNSQTACVFGQIRLRQCKKLVIYIHFNYVTADKPQTAVRCAFAVDLDLFFTQCLVYGAAAGRHNLCHVFVKSFAVII